MKNILLDKEIQSKLVSEGWVQLKVGGSQRKDYDKQFMLFKRCRPLEQFLRTKEPKNVFKNKMNTFEGQCTEDDDSHFESQTPSFKAFLNEKQHKMGSKQQRDTTGSNTPMGRATGANDPASFNAVVLSDFESFESLRCIRTEKKSLVIGFDSEWHGNPRKMLSWQFALIYGNDLHEYIFLKSDSSDCSIKNDLWLELALVRILEDLAFKRLLASKYIKYRYITSVDGESNTTNEIDCCTATEAQSNGVYAYVNGKPTSILIDDIKNGIYILSAGDTYSCYRNVFTHESSDVVDITLVGHSAIADITSFNQNGYSRQNVLRRLSSASGGIFSTTPIVMHPRCISTSSGHNNYFAIHLAVRDTMCCSPDGKQSLSDLGQAIGLPKLVLPDGSIEHMDRLLESNPSLFFEYASTDAVIALLYSSSIYGVNQAQAVTLLSAGTNVIQKALCEHLGVESVKDYNRMYRGLVPISHGLVGKLDRLGYVETRSLEPINRDVSVLQQDACYAYRGGYNSASDVGFYDIPTYDYDLQNAYPTSMCLVPDVDWEKCLLNEFEPNHVLTEKDFITTDGSIDVFPLMFAYVSFEFPTTVPFPCIPVSIEGIPVFPRTSDGLDGVYACGPELYLAVKLGATVTIKKGYTVNSLKTSNGDISYSLRAAVKQLVSDRRLAKKVCGKGSLEELILKLLVNGAYGKIAQNVIQKKTWSAVSDEMKDMGCSAITNPVSAAMVTSIVRATLIATQNQVCELGYKCYSVTTDGFISDIPEATLKQLDLFGLRNRLGNARTFLTDGADSEIWEIKHMQNDLLNFMTRGNVSLNTGGATSEASDSIPEVHAIDSDSNPVFELPGVCAHGGVKSGFVSDSYADRLWLMQKVLARDGRVSYCYDEWTEFKQLVHGEPFQVCKKTVERSMDYDMKRKPDISSMTTAYPHIENKTYEVANFSTLPFDSVLEFQTYREVKDYVKCLRTVTDWKIFFEKIVMRGTGAKPRDFEWARVNSIVMGHRSGLWTIPYLQSCDISVEDKCTWISSFCSSNKKFKLSDWKNARRPERQSKMLPRKELEELLSKMMDASNKLMKHIQDNHGEWCVRDVFFHKIDKLAMWFSKVFRKAA